VACAGKGRGRAQDREERRVAAAGRKQVGLQGGTSKRFCRRELKHLVRPIHEVEYVAPLGLLPYNEEDDARKLRWSGSGLFW
jgi:hypothetical protein